jgi:hypothetical protein
MHGSGGARDGKGAVHQACTSKTSNSSADDQHVGGLGCAAYGRPKLENAEKSEKGVLLVRMLACVSFLPGRVVVRRGVVFSRLLLG